ncbi:16S rRNA (uracil(1498)-N(3))-methyltransferase [Cetobacterium somerae]|uniref:RsmE family RNA methyltransferase n=1 Tax=Cetobacterium sp. NK01 TaxID=2993530 RepID=UPI002116EF7A|nr:16S rRNA (uracil(1498)-N(3))-methyltransferase [Cetobacterium sp. NK01]MCQ8211758.1 16S rRNA (uracil(1498)-N(3))-methyltransferase [Cetobacterium sp. NK01]
MISVIISKENIANEIIEIVDKNDINHLKNAFRIKTGEIIRAVDGEYEYICEVINIDKKIIEAKIIEQNEDRFSSKIYIEAAIGILKNDKMDLTIQKLTEIGITKITPLLTKRGVAKITEKKDKWDLIVREATKQCQAVKLVEISEPKKIGELNLEEYDLAIVPYECEEENSLRNILNKLESKPKKVLYIVGPEGGFEKEEIEFLKANGVIPVSLGKRILRAETASIIVGGVLVNEF